MPRWKVYVFLGLRKFRLLTLDDEEHVFQEYNLLYRMSDQEDVFIIANLAELHTATLTELPEQTAAAVPIIRFLGLLSSRDDLYPPEFLLKPDFYLKIEGSNPSLTRIPSILV